MDHAGDTMTTPTPAMLASLATASLGDEVYSESRTTTELEQRVAELFGKPSALFVLSGTMGNQLSLRSHLTQPPHSVVLDARSHIFSYEAGAAALLSQAHMIPVAPSNGVYLTLEDLIPHVVLSDNDHFAPTRVISLENTLAGAIQPLSEMARIGEWAHSHGLKVHLDGARLWNACSVPGAPSLAAYAATVDSLSVCFSKSLGAPVGSFIVGERTLTRRARHLRKAIGGGIRQAGILTAMMRVALDDVFLAGQLARANALTKRIEAAWRELDGEVSVPVDTNMVWLDLAARGVDLERWEQVAEANGVKVGGGRIVVHYQHSERSVDALIRAMREVCAEAGPPRVVRSAADAADQMEKQHPLRKAASPYKL